MANRFLKIAAIIMIVAGVVTSLYLNSYRLQYENNNKSAEVLLDFDELTALSRANQLPLKEISARFKEAGATGVLIRERTLDDLQNSGDLIMLSGGQIALQQQNSREAFPGIQPVKDNYYLFFQDKSTYETVKSQLLAKKNGITGTANDQAYYISVPLSRKEITGLGVGFVPKDLLEISKGGLQIVPRLRTWPKGEEKTISQIVESLKSIPALSMVTFNDATIPGQDNLAYFADRLRELKVPVGMFEFFDQKGLGSLALLMDKNVVRVHTISESDMGKYTESLALDRYSLAVSERNIRALYIRLFGMEQPGTALPGALNYIQDIKTTLEKETYTVGPATVPSSIPSSRAFIFVVGLGIAGAGIFVLRFFFSDKWTIVLAVLGLLGWAGLLVISPFWARKAGALLAVMVFPVMGMFTLIPEDTEAEKRSLKKAVLILLKMSGFSILGACIMTGLLADNVFMLKLDGFSGVKAAHIIPLLIVPAYFVFRGTNIVQRMQSILNDKVQVKHLLFGAVAVVALAIYIIRTGNDAPTLVSPLETQARSILDAILGVRPRTKEFLLGHPAMLALLYYGFRYDYIRIGLLGLGIIGQVSLVNTYAHIHTPLVISMIRSFHGLWLGILIGIILILAANYCLGWMKRRLS